MQFFRQFSVVPSVVNGHCTRLIVVRVIVRLVQRLAAASYGGDSNSRWEGMGLGLAAITALLCAMRAVGVYRFGSIALNGRDALRWAAIYGFVFLLVALREEFRARGYLQYTLSGGLGFWPAAVLTSAFFGYSHHANAGEDWIGLFNAGAVGLLFCLLLRRSGNLWMPIGFHLAFDWGETYLYGVPNSGHVLPGHLLSGSSSGACLQETVIFRIAGSC